MGRGAPPRQACSVSQIVSSCAAAYPRDSDGGSARSGSSGRCWRSLRSSCMRSADDARTKSGCPEARTPSCCARRGAGLLSLYLRWPLEFRGLPVRSPPRSVPGPCCASTIAACNIAAFTSRWSALLAFSAARSFPYGDQPLLSEVLASSGFDEAPPVASRLPRVRELHPWTRAWRTLTSQKTACNCRLHRDRHASVAKRSVNKKNQASLSRGLVPSPDRFPQLGDAGWRGGSRRQLTDAGEGGWQQGELRRNGWRQGPR